MRVFRREEEINKSVYHRGSADLCDERARFGGKISWEWEMSVGLGSIMVESTRIQLLDLLRSFSG